MTPNQSWVLRGNDFSKQGWHAKQTAGYRLMFEFLKISPSYEMARLHRTQGLTKDQKGVLPDDFDQVLRTYDLLGDVQKILFRSWWLNRGLKAFGNPYSKPKVHKISLLPDACDVAVTDINNDLNHFLGETRGEEGLSGSLLVSIPVGGRRSDVLKQINKLLGQHNFVETTKRSEDRPKLALMGKRLHVDAMLKGLGLLFWKSAQPKWENWRLGTFAELSKSYSEVLDYKAPKKTATTMEAVDRIIMGKITSRALKRFELIAENAARGRFPCDEHVDCSTYNYLELQKRIKLRKQWEKSEKERLARLI